MQQKYEHVAKKDGIYVFLVIALLLFVVGRLISFTVWRRPGAKKQKHRTKVDKSIEIKQQDRMYSTRYFCNIYIYICINIFANKKDYRKKQSISNKQIHCTNIWLNCCTLLSQKETSTVNGHRSPFQESIVKASKDPCISNPSLTWNLKMMLER